VTLARALKLHLRVLAIHGQMLRVVTLRPATGVRFSTNYFHATWHILADRDGADLLGRLLWGLAFQRHPGTLILIDRDHLVPTPFEADPPDPILLVPDGLTRIDDELLRALKLRLRRAPGPPRTIRWHTFGMARALTDEAAPWWWRDPKHRQLLTREQMTRRAGFVCYTAPPAVLRSHGLGIHTMGGRTGYYPLAERGRTYSWRFDGEIQLIRGLADQVAAARVARRDVLGADRPAIHGDDERWAIYRETERALSRLRAARRDRDRDPGEPEH
jgi:hypothetical protein